MQHDFWHQRWQDNQIGFHLPEANPLLIKHFAKLNLKQSKQIFLPLCGKTLDIAWLLAQGYQVVGVELSQIAIDDLFKNLNITPTITKLGELNHYSAKNIDIFVGDIFTLTPALLEETIGKVDAVYDRAALVALPADMRQDYTAHLLNLTSNAAQLTICFDYNQQLLAGPPFSVVADEVKQHYQNTHKLNLLESVAVDGGLKGVCPAAEQVWHLQPL